MNFQDFEKVLDHYRSGELPEAEAAQFEAFMFENAQAKSAFEADEELGGLLRASLANYPPVSPDRLRAVAQRAMRQIESEAAAGGVPASAARGKVAPTLGLLEWLLAPLRQPQLAAAAVGLFVVGGALGWGLRPQPAVAPATSSGPTQVAGVTETPATPELIVSDPDAAGLIQPVSVIQKSALMENLQSVKYDLMVAGNNQQYERLLQFEHEFTQMMPAGMQTPDNKEQGLAAYQAGESALMNGNATEATAQFSKVRELDKAGMLGFLATMNLANIVFNAGEDYPQALRLYESALNAYPAQYISDRNKVDVQKRIELITRNADDDYRPLRLFNQAQKSRPDLARVHYEQLMSLYPNSSVSGLAVDQLLHFALDYPDKQLLPANEAMKIFVVFVEKFPASRLVPQVYVAMGDLNLFRNQRPQQALLQYTVAMEQARDRNPDLAATVKSRVQYMVDNGLID